MKLKFKMLIFVFIAFIAMFTGLVYAADYATDKIDINNVSITDIQAQAYTGKAITPVVTVTNDEYALILGTDYTVAYKNNTKVGTSTVTITGIGNYTGTKTVNFKIGYNIASAKVTGVTSKTFNGKAQTQKITVKYGTKTLKSGTDYTVTYKDNKNAGTATLTITGKGNYIGTKKVTFKISAKKITGLSFSKVGAKTYTGKALTPGVTVKDSKTTLKKDTDYTVKYSSNTKKGTATVTITGKGNYTGSKKITFKINARNIKDVKVEGLGNKTYTGKAQKPSLKLTYNGMTLKSGTDYTVAYKNNTKVGTATITITGKGNFTGSIKKTFKITAKYISGLTYSGVTAKTYTGSAIKPSVTVKNGTTTLKNGTDYTVAYKNNTNKGTATITLTGKGNYTGKKEITFAINAKSVSGVTVSGVASKTYTGSSQTQKITVKDGKITLKEGTHYTVSYKNNTNAGTAIVIVTGKGNYTGVKEVTFKINKASIEKYTFGSIPNKTYTGSAIIQEVSVKNGSKVLVKDIDYTVAYKNNTKVGTSTVTITGKENYTGIKEVTFKIVACNISNATVDDISEHIYNGDPIRPAVTVKYNSKTLASGVDYTLNYSNNKNLGTGTVIITGKGNFTGSIIKTFKIIEQPNIPDPTPNYYNQFDAGEIHLRVGDYGCLNYTNDLAGKEIKSLISSDTKVIIVSKVDSSLAGSKLNSINNGDVYIDAVGEGVADVIAEATDGTIGKCKVRVQNAGITVIENTTSYSTRGEHEGVLNGNVSFGQSASSVLGAKGLEETNGYEYNHPSGLAYYKKGETVYYVVTDAWNNRVLIYTGTSIEDATSKDPTYILGQSDENTSTPGYELYEMNWPMDCAIDSLGRLYVADTHNNRILVYDDITNLKEITDKESKTRIVADHEISWWNELKHESHNDHLYWPWSVAVVNVNGVEKLIVTSTLGHSILIWNEIPENWGSQVSDKYPDLILETEESSTPRTITWTGTQLLIGDENIKDYGSGLRVFNGFPSVENLEAKAGVTKVVNGNQTIFKVSNSKILEDFVLTNTGDFGFNGGYGEGVMADGKLYMAFGCALHVWNDGRIDSDKDSGVYTFQIKENTYTEEGGPFLNGGGIYKLLYAENNLYLALHNGNYITGWKNIGADKLISTSNETFRASSKPDIYIGASEFKNNHNNTPASQYVKHNQIPLTDGEHLVVIDDLDQQVMVYKNIPTSSGAIADYIYNMPYGLGEGSLRKYSENSTDKTALILQSRTHNVIYIWTDYKFDGSMPDRIIGNNIGSKHLTGELIHVEFDGKYTYISTIIKDKPQVLIYDGIVNKNSEPVCVIDVSVNGQYIEEADNNLSISSNAEYVSFMNTGFKAYIFKTSQFTNSTLTLDDAYGTVESFEVGEEPNEINDPLDYNLCRETGFRIISKDGKAYHERTYIGIVARTLVASDGKYIVTDLAEDRLLIWNNIEDAIDGKEPTVLGHGQNLYDLDEVIGVPGAHDIQEATFEDTLYMPLYVTYDGYNIWVGEFKFSNRLLRYELK